MAKNIDICITAKDNYTGVLEKMKQSQLAFRKDLEGTQAKLDQFNKNKVSLKIEVDKARKELQDAKKNVAGLTEEFKEQNIALKQMEYDTAVDNLKAVEKAAKDARKEMDRLTQSTEDGAEKGKRSFGGGSGGIAGTFQSIMGAHGVTQLASQFTGALKGSILQGITSAYGQEEGIIASSLGGGILSGLGSGASAGFMLGGPLGAAIGAAVGGIVGGISGGIEADTQIKENKNQYFRDEVNEIYSNTTQYIEDRLASGRAIAGTREMLGVSFEGLLGKEKGEELLNQIHDFAMYTPFEYDDLAEATKSLMVYGVSAEDVIPMMTGIGNAGGIMGLPGAELAEIATYLGRVKMTGKTNLKYINPLLQRGIDVYGLYADAAGISREKAIELINDESKGLDGSDFVDKVVAQMNITYAGGMEKMSQTTEGLASTLEDIQADLDASLGFGFNEAYKNYQKGWINDFYTEENMGLMKEAYGYIGEYQAGLQGKEQDIRNQHILEAAKEIEEKGLKGDEAQQIMAEAIAEAQTEWKNSEEYRNKVKNEIELIGDIQEDVSKMCTHLLGYEVGDTLSKGAEKDSEVSLPTTPYFSLPQNMVRDLVEKGIDPYSLGFSYGISYVPYNDFPAFLHEGERVLTASENREYNEGSRGVVITGNSFVVREEADIYKIATELYDKLKMAKEGYVAS